jgi:hypothetical protein
MSTGILLLIASMEKTRPPSALLPLAKIHIISVDNPVPVITLSILPAQSHRKILSLYETLF